MSSENVSEIIFHIFITYFCLLFREGSRSFYHFKVSFTADLGFFKDSAEYDHLIQADAEGKA